MEERELAPEKYFKMVGSKWVPMTVEEINTPLAEKVTGLPASVLKRDTGSRLQNSVGRRGHDNGMSKSSG